MREQTVEFKGEHYTLKDLPMVVKRLKYRKEKLAEMRAEGMPKILIENEIRLVLEAQLLGSMIIDKFTDKDCKAEIRLLKALLKA